jgi:hypothetical protein
MIGNGVFWSRSIAAVALGAGALLSFPNAAVAVSSNMYCSDGPNGSTNSDTSSHSLSTGDVKLWTGSLQSASDCYGDFDPGNSSPSNEVAKINEIFGDVSGPKQLVYLDKTGAASSPTGLDGIRFTVEAIGGSSGLWFIAWEDTNGSSPSNAPLMVDLVVLLVGGNHSAAYLLSGLLVPFSPGLTFGTFEIEFPAGNSLLNGRCRDGEYEYDSKHKKNSKDHKNKKHKKKHKKEYKDCDKDPELSHLLLAGRLSPPTQIPEPSTTALFGAGLLGLWMFRRRRSQ